MKGMFKALCGMAVVLCSLLFVACDEEHTHQFGEWTTDISATCTIEGEESRVCLCGETESRAVEKLAHEFGAANLQIIDGVAYDVAVCANCPTENKTVNEAIMSLANQITFVATAQELSTAIANGGYIVVVSDITSESNFTLSEGQTVTVHLLDGVTVAGNGCDGVFYVTNGTLTLNGNGVVLSNACPDDGYSMALWAKGANAKIIVNGNEYRNGKRPTDEQYDGDLIYAKDNSEIIINDGKFVSLNPPWTLNLSDRTGAIISVKGGKFYGFNPAEANTEPGGVYSFVAEGFTVNENEENGITVYEVVEA